MREHVRHTLRTRDAQGGLTPDLERPTALPITAAGLVLAITGDAGRTAAMLQADPQQGLLLSHPVARAAALYALAREGLLGRGLETVERLATAHGAGGRGDPDPHRGSRRVTGAGPDGPATMTVNAALMIASGLQLIPPIVNTTLHHAATVVLLRNSMGLAETTHAEDP